MVAVGGVVQRALLVDDADARFVGADRDATDIVSRLAARLEQRMDLHGAFHRGLRVELGGEGDLEQDVLHHVAAVGPLELERPALEQDVVETQVGAVSAEG